MPDYSATRDAIATGTTIKTMIEIATPATHAAEVFHFWVDFDGVSASATPVLVEVVRATAAVGGSSALTPVRIGLLGPSTAGVTAAHTGTAGSGAGQSGANLGGVVWKRRIPPTTGFDLYLPDNRLIEVDVSGWLRVNVTAAATVNATVGLEWNE